MANKTKDIRKRLEILDNIKGVRKLMLDALRLSDILQGREHQDPQFYNGVVSSLRVEYVKELPAEVANPAQIDLEDLIQEMKQVYPKQFKDYGNKTEG